MYKLEHVSTVWIGHEQKEPRLYICLTGRFRLRYLTCAREKERLRFLFQS